MNKSILDVTCGNRGIWFNKHHPAAIYCDKRQEEYTQMFCIGRPEEHEKHINVDPDIICDFTDLPFADESFMLVVFDPPHVAGLSDKSWTKKQYGTLSDGWQGMIHKGFCECMRVLKPQGTLIFKWSETQISTAEVIKAIGVQPLFGHHSGKKSNTHWMAFMKLPEIKEDNR